MSSNNHQQQVVAVVGNLAETQLGFRSKLIEEMLNDGYQVLLFACDFTDETRARTKNLGATPIDYKVSRRGLNPLADVATCIQLSRLFRKHKVTVSFCSYAKPVIWGTLAAWLTRVPIRIAKIEGLGRVFVDHPEGISQRQRLLRKVMIGLFAFSLPKAHRVYVLNPDDKHDLTVTYGLKLKNIEILGGIGVCLDHYSLNGPSTDTMRFIFVGRLLNEKGIRYYLEAAKTLKAEHPKAEFIVLGQPDGKSGISRSELLEYVHQGIITYPGQVQNVVEWLQHSSVFVLPSYYREGVPRSTQEAMAVGRAVVTTNMPGCRETVEHQVNGLLIDCHSTKALIEAMQYLIDSPETVKRMGRESRRMAETLFDVKKINRRILDDMRSIKLLQDSKKAVMDE